MSANGLATSMPTRTSIFPCGGERSTPCWGKTALEIHPDERPDRAVPAYGGHHLPGWEKGAHRFPGPGREAGHRHGASALHAGGGHDGVREHHPGGPEHQGHFHRQGGPEEGNPGSGGALWSGRGAGPAHHGDCRGRPAAGGNPENPVSGRGAADSGRAHRRPDRHRGRGTVPDHP